MKLLALLFLLTIGACNSDQYITVIEPETDSKTQKKQLEKPKEVTSEDLSQSDEFSFLEGQFLESSNIATSPIIALHFSREVNSLIIEKRINAFSDGESCHVKLQTKFAIYPSMDEINEIYRSNDKKEHDYIIQYNINRVELVNEKKSSSECLQIVKGKNSILKRIHSDSIIYMVNTKDDENIQIAWSNKGLKKVKKD